VTCVQETPEEVTADEVLALVRSDWDERASAAVHLPLGFGAHHWRVDVAGRPRLFATYDRFGARHDLASLTAAYASAVALAERGLEFVLVPQRSRSGRVLVPVAHGALSCTRWVEGSVVGEGPLTDPATVAANIADLARLHACDPPDGLPRWVPQVSADLPERLAALPAGGQDAGPYGESARQAVAGRRRDIEDWTRRYQALAAEAGRRTWVVTHGETHTRNQLRTADGIRFVDWESVKLAPRERDLATLVQAGYGTAVAADPAMVELFDLEWRLAEIDEYAHWFAAPHTGTADDAIAYEGLLDELRRGPWWSG
jgi:spectinomycin phosphotransferase